jgi:hypothetical protein
MTKKEAKAILAMQKKINAAINSCLAQLEEEKSYAVNYWGPTLQSTVNGCGFGACPIARAEAVVNGDNAYGDLNRG